MSIMEEELREVIKKYGSLDAIVVEGYDGVGKGRVLSSLFNIYGVEPYRPDYNLWQKYDHRNTDRWKVSGFFWDVFSHFYRTNIHRTPMLFDRGVISGAVYNDDISIAYDYKKLIRDMKVLHILVVCHREDYEKFMNVRGVSTHDIVEEWKNYLKYTLRYRECLKAAGVSFIEYRNKYDEQESARLSKCCEGCGHYSYGICRHPKFNGRCVDADDLRCEYTGDKETQDMEVTRYAAEMQCV